MRVLVTFAVDAEFAPWRALRTFKKARINSGHWSGGLEVQEARVGDCAVWVYLTGIGIKALDFRLVSCLKDAGLSLAVSSGLAGSLKTEYIPEDIVVPRRVGSLRDASGIPATVGLVLLAERRGARVVDTLLTANRIVETREEKHRLAVFADVVDMESRYVMSGFTSENLPVVTIRAISDSSEEDLPIDFAKCLTPRGQIKIGAFFKELVGHPAKVPQLIRFGRQSRNAAKGLTVFLDGFIEALTPDVLQKELIEVSVQ